MQEGIFKMYYREREREREREYVLLEREREREKHNNSLFEYSLDIVIPIDALDSIFNNFANFKQHGEYVIQDLNTIIIFTIKTAIHVGDSVPTLLAK